jgi:hypothetical protein
MSVIAPVLDPTWPARSIIKITPSDTVPFPTCRALWVGTAGAATLIDSAGNTCAAFPLLQGLNQIAVSRINATGLLANDIWALY